MAFCAWCGSPVNEVSYAPCPRCGRPANGAPGAGKKSNTAAIIIGVVVGGLFLVAIVGILAAIAIPNLLTAQGRSKQKRTMADIRSVATAAEAYATDNNKYPEAGSVAELSAALSPTYIREVPSLDAWGTPMKYERLGDTGYGIASAGGDKTFEHDSLSAYTPKSISDFNGDLVFANGEFVQHPGEGN